MLKQIQKKSRGYIVRQIGPNWFKVFDGARGRTYDVNLGLNGGICTCAWNRHRPEADHRSGCSHVIAAMNYRAVQHGRRVSVWANEGVEDVRGFVSLCRQNRGWREIGSQVA